MSIRHSNTPVVIATLGTARSPIDNSTLKQRQFVLYMSAVLQYNHDDWILCRVCTMSHLFSGKHLLNFLDGTRLFKFHERQSSFICILNELKSSTTWRRSPPWRRMGLYPLRRTGLRPQICATVVRQGRQRTECPPEAPLAGPGGRRSEAWWFRLANQSWMTARNGRYELI